MRINIETASKKKILIIDGVWITVTNLYNELHVEKAQLAFEGAKDFTWQHYADETFSFFEEVSGYAPRMKELAV